MPQELEVVELKVVDVKLRLRDFLAAGNFIVRPRLATLSAVEPLSDLSLVDIKIEPPGTPNRRLIIYAGCGDKTYDFSCPIVRTRQPNDRRNKLHYPRAFFGKNRVTITWVDENGDLKKPNTITFTLQGNNA